jgi:cytoskeleton protein RodZ
MESAIAIESPGRYLRAARESRGLSLNDVAHATRIREPVLLALEEDRYMDLPPLYVKSFLTAYAERLGLNPNEVTIPHQKNPENQAFPKDRLLKDPSAARSKKGSRLLLISIILTPPLALLVYGLLAILE